MSNKSKTIRCICCGYSTKVDAKVDPIYDNDKLVGFDSNDQYLICLKCGCEWDVAEYSPARLTFEHFRGAMEKLGYVYVVEEIMTLAGPRKMLDINEMVGEGQIKNMFTFSMQEIEALGWDFGWLKENRDESGN